MLRWADKPWNLRRLFQVALVYRLVAAIFVATYFNPDEFWQNQEVSTRLVYGTGTLTWEWKPYAQIRGFIHPGATALCYWLLKTLRLDFPCLIAWSPRLIQAVLTSVSDVYLYRLALRWSNYNQQIAKWTIFLLYTNWFSFYCASRPYSNSAEAAFLIIGLYYFPFSSERWSPSELLYIYVPSLPGILHSLRRQFRRASRCVANALQEKPERQALDAVVANAKRATQPVLPRTPKRETVQNRINESASGKMRSRSPRQRRISTPAEVSAGHLDAQTRLQVFASRPSRASSESEDSPAGPQTRQLAVPQPLISSGESSNSLGFGWDLVFEGYQVSFVMLALCVLVRPASLAYIAPLVISFLYSCWTDGHIQRRRYRMPIAVALVRIAIYAIALSTILDSVIYCYLSPTPRTLRELMTFVPWNFFRFNSLHDIGALYGTHPWHWNFTQGLPAILTVLTPLFYFSAIGDAFTLVLPSDSDLDEVESVGERILRVADADDDDDDDDDDNDGGNGNQNEKCRRQWTKVPQLSRVPTLLVLTILVVFSMPSHKEFRFLLPALPLALLPTARLVARLDAHLNKSILWNGYLACILIVFCSMSCFFGVIHQSGPISAVRYVSNEVHAKTALPSGVLMFMPCHSTPYLSFFTGQRFSDDLQSYLTRSTVSTKPVDVILRSFDCSPNFGPPPTINVTSALINERDWILLGNGNNTNSETHILRNALAQADEETLDRLLEFSLISLESQLPPEHSLYVLTFGSSNSGGKLLSELLQKRSFRHVRRFANHVTLNEFLQLRTTFPVDAKQIYNNTDPEAWVDVYHRIGRAPTPSPPSPSVSQVLRNETHTLRRAI